MTVWRPIETAPKDGTAVALYAGTREEPFQCGMWITSVNVWTEETEGCWWLGDGRYADQPTHWMQLPPAPEPRPC